MHVAQDLTIIAPHIATVGADIFAGGQIRLVARSSDALVFNGGYLGNAATIKDNELTLPRFATQENQNRQGGWGTVNIDNATRINDGAVSLTMSQNSQGDGLYNLRVNGATIGTARSSTNSRSVPVAAINDLNKPASGINNNPNPNDNDPDGKYVFNNPGDNLGGDDQTTPPVISQNPPLPNNDTLALGALDSEVDRNRLASDLDVTFRQTFTPRGFAASDDEIQQAKDAVSSTAAKNNKGKVNVTRSFRAH
jgi:hypothetical protein